MQIKYDRDADAMRISFQHSGYEISEEIEDGVILDKTSDGKIIALEILDASEKFSKDVLAKLIA